MMRSTWLPSPHFAKRLHPIRYIVLHCTEIEDDHGALSVYTDPTSELSCHYYIDYQGALFQLVQEADTAWHAGVSAWKNIQSLNHHSIGIEIGYPGEKSGKPYPEKQYLTLLPLLKELMAHYKIPPENILAHSDIAPSRKADPGKYFDWPRLQTLGLASTWAPNPAFRKNPFEALKAWGWRGEEKDVITAFQRRYLPQAVSGVLCTQTKAFILGEAQHKKP